MVADKTSYHHSAAVAPQKSKSKQKKYRKGENIIKIYQFRTQKESHLQKFNNHHLSTSTKPKKNGNRREQVGATRMVNNKKITVESKENHLDRKLKYNLVYHAIKRTEKHINSINRFQEEIL